MLKSLSIMFNKCATCQMFCAWYFNGDLKCRYKQCFLTLSKNNLCNAYLKFYCPVVSRDWWNQAILKLDREFGATQNSPLSQLSMESNWVSECGRKNCSRLFTCLKHPLKFNYS